MKIVAASTAGKPSRPDRGILPLLLILLLFTPAPLTAYHEQVKDDALDAIVSLIASAPEDAAILERAVLWADEQKSIPDLITAVANRGKEQRSSTILSAAISMAQEQGWLQQAVELLESSLEISDLPETRHQLAQLWIAGGWAQQAKLVAAEELDSPLFQDIRLGLSLIEGFVPTEVNLEISSATISQLARVAAPSEWACSVLESRGEIDAALKLAVSGGLTQKTRALLESGARLDDPIDRLKLARLLGVDRWGTELLVEDGKESGSRWQASMGFAPILLANPYRSEKLPPLQMAIQQLNTGDEQAARRSVALWRLSGGGLTRQDISTRLILENQHPDWFGPDRLGESIEEELRRSSDASDAIRAQAAALKAFEGTPVEARLWFQAGRLGANPDWIARAMRIFPAGEVSIEWVPGIEVHWKQPEASSVTDPLALIPPTRPRIPGALLGAVNSLPVRQPGPPERIQKLFLHDWQPLETKIDVTSPAAQVRLHIAADLWLEGDGKSLRVSDESTLVAKQLLRLVAKDGQSLTDKNGFPRSSILAKIFRTTDPEKRFSVTENLPPLGPVLGSFCEAATRRARNPELLRWIDIHPAEAGGLRIDVAGVSGLFLPIPAPLQERHLPADLPPLPEYTPIVSSAFPRTDLILTTTRRHGIRPTASRPLVEINDSPKPLLPAREQVLVSKGSGDRVVVTDSGLVGYFLKDSSTALWWKELLQPPLPGIAGFAPLPTSSPLPGQAWADDVTPRLIEVNDSNGQSRFLLLARDPIVIEANQIEEYPSFAPLQRGYSGGTIDDHGNLLLLSADGQTLITSQDHYTLPRPGAYQLISTSQITIVIGQDAGETWLARFDGEQLHEIAPPPLPDERDRPQLRVAALGRWQDEVLLVADRVWKIDGKRDAHRALTPPPQTGNYRPVHWIQPVPRLTGNRLTIERPWGVTETWRAP